MQRRNGAPADVAGMQRELDAMRRTVQVLKQRVARGMADERTSFGVVEQQAHMQRVIDERTEELRLQATRAKQLRRAQARVEALLNETQRLAHLGGWLYDVTEDSLQHTGEFLRLLEIDPDGPVTLEDVLDHFRPELRDGVRAAIEAASGSQTPFELEGQARTGDGREIWVRVQGRAYTEDGRSDRILGMLSDVTERKAVEARMALSQKLESIGSLAAGVAHEINTPTQYIADNTRFLAEAFEELVTVTELVAGWLDDGADASCVTAEALGALRTAMEEADYEYLVDEIPKAISNSMDGLQRVAKIVRSMKTFSHPSAEMQPTDLNRAIESTVDVARHEWRYVADVELDLDADLRAIPCFESDFSQVVLNMIVNAAHAIADVVGDGSRGKGVIRISTASLPDACEVRIADTGAGMTAEVRARIFDQFFTTKEVGRGTGQGLSIAHDVIVVKHGGTIDVESTPGEGTTFVLRLPKTQEVAAKAA